MLKILYLLYGGKDGTVIYDMLYRGTGCRGVKKKSTLHIMGFLTLFFLFLVYYTFIFVPLVNLTIVWSSFLAKYFLLFKVTSSLAHSTQDSCAAHVQLFVLPIHMSLGFMCLPPHYALLFDPQ